MDTVESLKQIEADQRKLVKSEKIKVGLLLFLNVFVICYMSWIYSFVSKELTPDKVSNDLGNVVSAKIDPLRQQITENLVEQAHVWSEKSLKNLADSPTQLREHFEAEITDATQHLVATFEASVNHQIEQHVDGMLKELDERVPHDGNTDDKMELIVDQVVLQFRDVANTSIEKLRSDMTVQVNTVNQTLDRLLTAADLTPEEQLHKEIIEVTLALLKVNVQGNGELKLMPDFRLVDSNAFSVFETSPDHPSMEREKDARAREAEKEENP